MYKEFNVLIGSQFKDITSNIFTDVQNYETIGFFCGSNFLPMVEKKTIVEGTSVILHNYMS